MPSRWQTYQIAPVGGLNLDENPNAVRKDEIIEALNVYYRGNAIGVRPGAAFETEANGYTANLPGAVQGVYEWVRDNGSTRNLMVVANGTIYSDGVPTSITKSAGVNVAAGADRTWTFCQFGYGGNQRMFAAGGSGTDTPWYYPDAFTQAGLLQITDSGGVNLVSPTYIYSKWKRVFAAGWRTAAGAISTDIACDPMTPRYSALNDPLTWPLGNTFAGTGIGGLPAYGDEYLTGFGEYTDNDGDWLLLLTNRRLYAVQEDPGNAIVPFYISRKGAIQFGCVHQNAFVSLGLDSGDAIYLSNHGIHSLRQTQDYGGREDRVLSWKIRSYFKTLNRSRLKYAVGSYLREEGLVVFAVPVGSDTFNSVLLVLDTKSMEDEPLSAKNARWSIWRLTGPSEAARKVTVLAAAKSSAGVPYLYAGNEAGGVFRFDEEASADFGTYYDASFSTRWEDFGDATKDKTMGDLYVQSQQPVTIGATLRATARYDFGARTAGPYPVELPVTSGSSYGTAVYGRDAYGASQDTNSQRVYVTGHGTVMSLNFQRQQEPFYIAGISGRVSGAGPAREVA